MPSTKAMQTARLNRKIANLERTLNSGTDKSNVEHIPELIKELKKEKADLKK